MKKFVCFLTVMLGCLAGRAEEYPFQVFNPTETKVRAEKHHIYPHVKILIDHLDGPKKSTFIKTKGKGNPFLFWRIETLTIVSPELVAVGFSEGHLAVIGVYVRDFEEKRWDLVAEVDGTFAERTYKDPTNDPETP